MSAEREFACRSCGHQELEVVLSLGSTPLANALLKAEDLGRPEPTYPLTLAFCPACTLVQILETVSPEALFSEYVYFSSFSDTMVRHAAQLTHRLTQERRLDEGSLVVEVASNDGYLLQHYRDAGIPVLGIEPAANIAEVAESRGIPTLCEFFGEAVGQRLAGEGSRADVIHANNVLAHVPDLNGFVRGFERLLEAGGVAIIEAPYVRDMIEGCEFDTIYHEHLCYFSLTAVDQLFTRNGLRVHDVEKIPIHGGSLRMFVSRASDGVERSPRVTAMLADEGDWGVSDVETYRRFAAHVVALGKSLRNLLNEVKETGNRVAAYGASAKGSTLLNFFGIGKETLDFVADRSTVKQGRFTPGSHLEIRSPDHLLTEMPDYVLLLTWNFADEILAQQRAFRERGGRFILPVPEPRVV